MTISDVQHYVRNQVWDTDTLAWVVMTAAAASGGGLTDAELRASPVPVLATIDTTGLATSGGQTTGNNSLSAIDTKLGAGLGHLPATTATVTSVSSSATSVQLLAATPGRRMATIKNKSTALLYVKYGTTASASSFTVDLPAGAYFEFPHPVYPGRVDGIWESANGNAQITELT